MEVIFIHIIKLHPSNRIRIMGLQQIWSVTFAKSKHQYPKPTTQLHFTHIPLSLLKLLKFHPFIPPPIGPQNSTPILDIATYYAISRPQPPAISMPTPVDQFYHYSAYRAVYTSEDRGEWVGSCKIPITQKGNSNVILWQIIKYLLESIKHEARSTNRVLRVVDRIG